ncbi:MAG: hypothetical protein A4E53_04642 [Pelotomaculum sp. PtaB.Bin104]|nr:MAG: hypothetical protein A4E53_04642 [Pelotomaculum sp. PtaB.Bin104]
MSLINDNETPLVVCVNEDNKSRFLGLLRENGIEAVEVEIEIEVDGNLDKDRAPVK